MQNLRKKFRSGKQIHARTALAVADRWGRRQRGDDAARVWAGVATGAADWWDLGDDVANKREKPRRDSNPRRCARARETLTTGPVRASCLVPDPRTFEVDLERELFSDETEPCF